MPFSAGPPHISTGVRPRRISKQDPQASALPLIDDTLAAAAARYNLELTEDQIESLDRYCQLLWDWNEKLNLTRHTTYDKFVARDLVDTFQLEQLLDSGERVLDVGTGGGVPGVILALLRADLQVSVCESVAKKARAIAAIIEGLGVNIPTHHARAEDLLVDMQFDTLVARAVAPLPKLLTWFAPHWDAFGRLLVIKGPAWVEERHEAREKGLMSGLELRKLAAYPLPGAPSSESVVLQIRPKPS